MKTVLHYRQSELLALLLTSASIKEIAHSLLLTENQAQQAASAVYKRAKADGRMGLMAQEIERLRERKGIAA